MFSIVCDLQKAFNILPRSPVLPACVKLCVPAPILRGWWVALCATQFSHQGSQSTKGFPEGCAMLVINLLLMPTSRKRYPTQSPLLGRSRTDAGCDCGFISLSSLSPRVRRALRLCGASGREQLAALACQIKHSCRDFGAHKQGSARYTNAS